MARWIVTDCRKLTEAEMSAVKDFQVIDTKYGKSMKFSIKGVENSWFIPLSSDSIDETFQDLREIRILTLRCSQHLQHILRVSNKDVPTEDFEEYLRKEEVAYKARVAKSSGSIFDKMIPY